MPHKDPEKRKACNRSAVARYKQRTKGATAYKDSRGRAERLKALPHWLSNEHRRAMRETYDACVAKSREAGIPHHVDHIWPLRGTDAWGLHVPWNLRVLEGAANHQKSNKTPEEPGWSTQS